MADDVKGSFWTSAESGKPEAGDIRKRKKTLPIVWALQNASQADQARLREIYNPDASTSGQAMPQHEVDEVLEILERAGAREHTLNEARRFRDQALADIAELPTVEEPRGELLALVQSVIAL
jgi:geranylgeranyl diphosphate synthase type I